MTPTNQGSIRLFRAAGIDLYLHWSWFLVAYYQISLRAGRYTSLTWNVLEYLALFCIVLLHEFGHSLACRQVGGKADRIVLWPLGGVAYVQPPQRPGATLWSIAAGPLVNVVLIPVLLLLVKLAQANGLDGTMPDAFRLLQTVAYINTVILIFNLLPIYPLDGGQILRSLLWFFFGRAWSLMAAAVVGFIGVACLFLLALAERSAWIGVLAVFILLNCWRGLRNAMVLVRAARMPRREGFACPACRMAPPRVPVWTCPQCQTKFDMFETHGVCPACGSVYVAMSCLDCGTMSPISAWTLPAPTQDLPPADIGVDPQLP